MIRPCTVAAFVLAISSGCSSAATKPATNDGTATAKCLKERFEIVLDDDVRRAGSWYGARMTGRIAVLTGSSKTAEVDWDRVNSVEIGFATSEPEAKKVEEWLDRHSAVRPDTVSRRLGDVVILWGIAPPADLRAAVESCVTRAA